MGGTFDPIHVGHLIIATYAMDQLDLDQIWFLPTGNPPHKTFKKTPKEIRRDMVALATRQEENMSVCSYEVNQEKTTYTYETMQYLQESYPEDDFVFLMGTDSLETISSWYRYRELLRMVPMGVAYRDPDARARLNEVVKRYQKDGALIDWIEMPIIEISSTEIRKRVSENKSIRFLVPDPVEKWILEEGLYR